MKVKSTLTIILFIYFSLGVLVFMEDIAAGLIYLTVFPFHIYLFMQAIKRNQIMFGVFFMLILFSHGIHSFTFFLFPNVYAPTGFNAIGNFDFSLSYFFKVYFYVFVFMIGVYIVSIRTGKKLRNTGSQVFKSLYESLNAHAGGGIHRTVLYEYLTVFVCFFGCCLAIFMYSNQIGITGITPVRLPFHLTGIIYYFRKYVLVAMILFCYLKSSKRRMAYFAVCFYSIFGGVAFASKGVAAFILFPIAMIEFVSKNKKKAVFTILYFLFLYDFISSAKNILYLNQTINTPFFTYIWSVITNYKWGTTDFVSILNNFSGRLFGMQTSVLAYQHANGSIFDLVSFYMGESIGSIVPDMATSMFGIRLSSNFSFGVAIGYIATAIYLSGRSFILIFLQGMFMGWVFSIHERCIDKCISKDLSKLQLWIIIGISLLGLASVWLNTSLLMIYAATIVNCVIVRCKIPKIPKFVIQRHGIYSTCARTLTLLEKDK